MRGILADVRILLISARRAPLIPGLVVLSLAIGIAVNTTMFSAFDAFLLRPLPYEDADRIVRVWVRDTEGAYADRSLSAPDFEHLRRGSRAVELAAFAPARMSLAGIDEPEQLHVLRVTGNFFQVLAPQLLVGHASLTEAMDEGTGLTAIISEGLWKRRFGGDPGAVGGVLLLDGQAFTVVGVVRDQFLFHNDGIDVYAPLGSAASEPAGRLSAIGRLRPGFSIEAAASEMKQIGVPTSDGIARPAGTAVTLMRLDRTLFNEAFRTAGVICSVAVVFVLLIACSNAANLLLVRAASRHHEIGVRAALGAGRGRLVRQLLTESLVLAGAAGAVGSVLAYWGVQGLIAIMPADIPMVERIALDQRALIFTLGVSLLAGILAGLAPALHTTRHGIRSVSRGPGGGAVGAGGRGSRLRSSIAMAQMALAMVLLICTGLLVKGYARAMDTRIGLEADNLLTLRVSIPESASGDTSRTAELLARLESRVAGVPGVQRVALADALPMTRWGSTTRYHPSDAPDREPGIQAAAELRFVSAGFFDAMHITVRGGRAFSAEDRRGAPPVVVINAALARTHWRGVSPIGRFIEYDGVSSQIVGVVDDVNEWGAAAPPPRTIYAPLAQSPARSVAVAVRSDLPAEALLPRLREAVKQEDPNLPVTDIATMNALIRNSQPRNRLMVRLLGTFASVAAVLAVLGVYGVMAHNVSRRTSEFGVRMAMGARGSDIVRLMLGHGAKLAAAAVLIGVAAALGVTRFLAAFINGVSPFDLTIFAGASTLLFSAAIAACLIPARRASQISPQRALRAE